MPETHGIFSGGQGLFDDEDEDDLWNPGKNSFTTSNANDLKKLAFYTRFLLIMREALKI